MEGSPVIERLAEIDLDTYLEALPVGDEVDGQVMQNEHHLFYHWLSKTYVQFGNIDGASLEDLYLKNVIETGMSEADFSRYCNTHNFPYPVSGDTESGLKTYYDLAFSVYMQEEATKRIADYEAWAATEGIATTLGSVTRFRDHEGKVYRVRTDAINCGQIIPD